MKLVQQVEEVTAEILPERAKYPDLRAHAEFYHKKERNGVVLKRTYDLPPIDMIGRMANRPKKDVTCVYRTS